jgi:sulfide:quinone oxidoreductase
MNQPPSPALPHVVIAGGGVAALEALIALHELARDRLHVTLLAPGHDFVCRPMAVAEPFCLGRAERHRLAGIAHDFGAAVVHDALAGVDTAARTVTGSSGVTLPYDSLLVATGARPEIAYRHAITFGVDDAPETMWSLLTEIGAGSTRRVAFVVPGGVAWSLPLYELAIMTARDVWSAGIDSVELTLVTPEERPLEIFGPEAASLVSELLTAEGIEFLGSTTADVRAGVVLGGSRSIGVDQTVTLPRPAGHRIPGLPTDEAGFLPVDQHGRVLDVPDVLAAGDVTDFPIKQGGLAAQQAVAAAETIAARHGVDIDPAPFRPMLRGMLLTGGDSRWMRAPAGDTPAASRASVRALWWPPTKIASRYLAPYLLGRQEAARLEHPPAEAHRVERRLAALDMR